MSFIKPEGITKSNQLHTICESGNCPNMGEWGAGTTFMILGNICTRSCEQNVATGFSTTVDTLEPFKLDKINEGKTCCYNISRQR